MVFLRTGSAIDAPGDPVQLLGDLYHTSEDHTCFIHEKLEISILGIKFNEPFGTRWDVAGKFCCTGEWVNMSICTFI